MSKSNWNTANIGDQSGRLVIITGAASGIGKEAARILVSKGANVIIAARNEEKATDAIAEIHVLGGKGRMEFRYLDLCDLDSVTRFTESIKRDFDRLDVLINNAGIMMCPKSQTKDGFEIQMGTNHLGHFALTGQLLPLLEKTDNSRIVVLSSIAHKMSKLDVTDLNWETRKYNTNTAYGDSKIANLHFMYELVRKLDGRKNAPVIAAAHPGWTQTDLQRHSGLLQFLNGFFSQKVADGALPTLRAGFDQDVESGDFYGPSRFFEMRGAPIKVASNKASRDGDIAASLWQASEELTGVHFP